ncbi:MAG TPA: GNAT family N-acetyltransferase [Chthoniobacterales bacterium]|nr:GNAT family N-acetyltransferase [Chthoniobacterales bacterium]
MNYPDTVHFQFYRQGVDWQLLLRLFKATNMGGREGDKVRRAFEKSTLVCFAKDGLQLIAAGRALTDGEYHATIYDLVVDPNYQRQGVGTRLMNELLAGCPCGEYYWLPMLEFSPSTGGSASNRTTM